MNRTRRVRGVEQSEAGPEPESPSELVERELEAVRSYLSWARRDLDVARTETESALELVARIRAQLAPTRDVAGTAPLGPRETVPRVSRDRRDSRV